MKATPLLPEDYTLLIAGSIHPFNHIDYKEGDDHLLAIQELIEKEGLQQRVIFKPSAATDEEFMESIDAVDIVVCSGTNKSS